LGGSTFFQKSAGSGTERDGSVDVVVVVVVVVLVEGAGSARVSPSDLGIVKIRT
jgi:hypothetical protein